MVFRLFRKVTIILLVIFLISACGSYEPEGIATDLKPPSETQEAQIEVISTVAEEETPLPTDTTSQELEETSPPTPDPDDPDIHDNHGIWVYTQYQLPSTLEEVTIDNADELQRLGILGRGQLIDIKFSDDNKWLAANTSVGVVVFDGENYDERYFIYLGGLALSSSFSPDIQQLAIGTQDKGIVLVDISEGKITGILSSETNGDVQNLAYRDQDHLIAAVIDRSGLEIQEWDLKNYSLLNTNRIVEDSHLDKTLLSDDGSILVTFEYGDMRIWDAIDGTMTYEIGIGGGLQDAVLSPDNRYLARTMSTEHWGIQIIDIRTNEHHISLFAPQSQNDKIASALTFSSDGTMLAASYPRNLVIYRTEDGTLVNQVDTKSDDIGVIKNLELSPNGNHIAYTTTTYNLYIFDISEHQLVRTKDHFSGDIYTIKLDPTDSLLYTHENRGIFKWDLQTGENKLIEPYYQPMFLWPGKEYFAIERLGNIEIWNSTSGNQQSVTNIEQYGFGQVWSAFFSPDDSLFIFSTFIGQANVGLHAIEVRSGELVRSVGYPIKIKELSNCNAGELICAVSIDGTIDKWRMNSGALVGFSELPKGAETQSISSGAFSPDGKYYAYQGSIYPAEIYVWDTDNDEITSRIKDYYLSAMTFSADNKMLVGLISELMEDIDETLVLIRISDGDQIKPLYTSNPRAVKFSHNGTLILITTATGIIELWGIPR